jgi:hypothetical protein
MRYISDCGVAAGRNVFRIRIRLRDSAGDWTTCDCSVPGKVYSWSTRNMKHCGYNE